MRSRGGCPRGTPASAAAAPLLARVVPGPHAEAGSRGQRPAEGGRPASDGAHEAFCPCHRVGARRTRLPRRGEWRRGRPHPSRPGPPSSPFAFRVGEEALALRGRGGVGPLPSPREGPASLGAGTRSFSNVPWAGGRGAWPGEGPWPGRRPSPPGRRARPRAALPHCSEGAWGGGVSAATGRVRARRPANGSQKPQP